MNRHSLDYFRERSPEREGGHFHRVLPVHESQGLDWELLSAEVPTLPRGWFELSHLSPRDRIEFSRAYLLNALPPNPRSHEKIAAFFDRLDDIGIYVTQSLADEPYEAHLVYSLADNSGFFHGAPPASEEAILSLKSAFDPLLLPADYLAFLEVHNGFSKVSDTGVTPIERLPQLTKEFHAFLESETPLARDTGEPINPRSLLPFYESFGLHCYQCFWSEWYPEQEMGNVYYSGIERSLSDPKLGSAAETMSFPTFLDWLVFYVEGIE